MKRNHKHATLIQQWLDDDSLVLQFKTNVGIWVDDDLVQWVPHYEYRFKPRTIRIGDFDVPEPMRVAPEFNEKYFVVDINQRLIAYEAIWSDSDFGLILLKRGLCHATREAAELHARALISLTEVK